MSRRQLASDAWANLRFRLHGSTDSGTDELRERIGEAITGVPVRQMRRLAPEVLAGVLPKVYPEVLAEAHRHQDEGRAVFIVTAASQEMAEMLAHVLDLDGGVGYRSEIENDVYTGRPSGPFTYREGKAQAVRELAVAEGIDLAGSYAYSDSESDLPMLRAVGHAVVVNPDAELGRIAVEEGWRVMRLDRIGRRLKLAGAVLLTVAAAGAGGAIAGRR